MAERKPIYTEHESRERLRSKPQPSGTVPTVKGGEHTETATVNEKHSGSVLKGGAKAGPALKGAKQLPNETVQQMGERLRKERDAEREGRKSAVKAKVSVPGY